MPAGHAGGGAGGLSVFRPTAIPIGSRPRVAGRVWMPRLTRSDHYGILAPVSQIRRRRRQQWLSASGGPPAPPPPPPPPPPPTVAIGLLTPIDAIRGVRWQRWRPSVGAAPQSIQGRDVLRPLTSVRPRPAGRAMLQRGVPQPTPGTPLHWSIARGQTRPRPGRVEVPNSLGPSDVQFAARLGLKVSSPRRLPAGRVLVPRIAAQPTPVLYTPILRPVSSPRRLAPGSVKVPRGAPTDTFLTPLKGLFVSSPRRLAAGKATVLKILPVTVVPTVIVGLLVPTTQVRRTPRVQWRGALAGAPPVLWTSGVKPITSVRPRPAGRAVVGRMILPVTQGPPPFALIVRLPSVRAKQGHVWIGSFLRGVPAVDGPVGLAIRRPISSPRAAAKVRQVYAPRFVVPLATISRFAGSMMVARRGDEKQRRRPGWLLHWLPIPLGGSATLSAISYNVYGNAGGGEPINYTTPIAVVSGFTWTSGPLAHPGDWLYGVRAFNSYGEEQNLDAAVEIILDAAGNDISNQPEPPIGLRAIAQAGATIRVEWSYPFISRGSQATGFHVYTGTGGAVSYVTPAATVLFATGIAGSFAATLSGLVDGTIYTIGVRAYNATAEEQNTTTVTVTADATGPAPVDSLMGIAV